MRSTEQAKFNLHQAFNSISEHHVLDVKSLVDVDLGAYFLFYFPNGTHVFIKDMNRQELSQRGQVLPPGYSKAQILAEVTRRSKLTGVTSAALFVRMCKAHHVGVNPLSIVIDGAEYKSMKGSFMIPEYDKTEAELERTVSCSLMLSKPEKAAGGKVVPVPTDDRGNVFPKEHVPLSLGVFQPCFTSTDVAVVRSNILKLLDSNGDSKMSQLLFMLEVHNRPFGYTSAIPKEGTMLPTMKKALGVMSGTVIPLANQKAIEAKFGLKATFGTSYAPLFAPSNAIRGYKMWSFMLYHSVIRGRDKKGLSVLTAPYIYGDLTPAICNQVAAAQNLLAVFKQSKADAINYCKSKNFAKAWNVLALNVPVADMSAIEPMRKYGVGNPNIRDSKETFAPKKYLSVFDLDVTINVGKNNTIVTSVPESSLIGSVHHLLNIKGIVAIQVPILPEVVKAFEGKLYPSLPAHSGKMWICSFLKSSLSGDILMDRCVKAVQMKTYYQFTRRTFAAVDTSYPYDTIIIKRGDKTSPELTYLEEVFQLGVEPVAPESEEDFLERIDRATAESRKLIESAPIEKLPGWTNQYVEPVVVDQLSPSPKSPSPAILSGAVTPKEEMTPEREAELRVLMGEVDEEMF